MAKEQRRVGESEKHVTRCMITLKKVVLCTVCQKVGGTGGAATRTYEIEELFFGLEQGVYFF